MNRSEFEVIWPQIQSQFDSIARYEHVTGKTLVEIGKAQIQIRDTLLSLVDEGSLKAMVKDQRNDQYIINKLMNPKYAGKVMEILADAGLITTPDDPAGWKKLKDSHPIYRAALHNLKEYVNSFPNPRRLTFNITVRDLKSSEKHVTALKNIVTVLKEGRLSELSSSHNIGQVAKDLIELMATYSEFVDEEWFERIAFGLLILVYGLLGEIEEVETWFNEELSREWNQQPFIEALAIAGRTGEIGLVESLTCRAPVKESTEHVLAHAHEKLTGEGN